MDEKSEAVSPKNEENLPTKSEDSQEVNEPEIELPSRVLEVIAQEVSPEKQERVISVLKEACCCRRNFNEDNA
jgi:hypothetical protein